MEYNTCVTDSRPRPLAHDQQPGATVSALPSTAEDAPSSPPAPCLPASQSDECYGETGASSGDRHPAYPHLLGRGVGGWACPTSPAADPRLIRLETNEAYFAATVPESPDADSRPPPPGLHSCKIASSEEPFAIGPGTYDFYANERGAWKLSSTWPVTYMRIYDPTGTCTVTTTCMGRTPEVLTGRTGVSLAGHTGMYLDTEPDMKYCSQFVRYEIGQDCLGKVLSLHCGYMGNKVYFAPGLGKRNDGRPFYGGLGGANQLPVQENCMPAP